MTQREYEDYMYVDSESSEDSVIVAKNLEEELFLKKLHADAIASYYDLLAERYDCVS